jgi:hypothetical protein
MANPILTDSVCDIENPGHIPYALAELLDVRLVTFTCAGGAGALNAAGRASTAVVDQARAGGLDCVRSFLADSNGPLRFMRFGDTIAPADAATHAFATALLTTLLEKLSQHPPFRLRVVGLPLNGGALRPIPPALALVVPAEEQVQPEDICDELAAGGPPRQFAIDGRTPALDAVVLYYNDFDCEIEDFDIFRSARTAPRVVRMAAMEPTRVDCAVTRSDRFIGMPPAE